VEYQVNETGKQDAKLIKKTKWPLPDCALKFTKN